jgi:hypothetical protein
LEEYLHVTVTNTGEKFAEGRRGDPDQRRDQPKGSTFAARHRIVLGVRFESIAIEPRGAVFVETDRINALDILLESSPTCTA